MHLLCFVLEAVVCLFASDNLHGILVAFVLVLVGPEPVALPQQQLMLIYNLYCLLVQVKDCVKSFVFVVRMMSRLLYLEDFSIEFNFPPSL